MFATGVKRWPTVVTSPTNAAASTTQISKGEYV